MSIYEKLQKIDRKILFVLMAIVIVVPLLIRPKTHPKVIFQEVRDAHRVLDKVQKDQVVLISTVWSAGALGENRPQTEVIARHLFMNNTKFIVVSWDPVGAQLVYESILKVQKELGKEYGRDWVHLGYRPLLVATLMGMSKDFQKTMVQDMFNTKLSELPASKNVKSHKDIGAVVEITPSSTIEIWISWFNMPNNIPLIYCPTAVMAAEAYPYLDSKQVKGMLNGVIGAAQYEVLLGMSEERTYASAASFALSAAHLLIIFLIIIGNIGYVLQKRQQNKKTMEKAKDV
ncbi:MAG: hypothetical protein SNJ70_06210 [Armatimonadota bacterium]